MKRPDFLICGAQKGGTTSLLNYAKKINAILFSKLFPFYIFTILSSVSELLFTRYFIINVGVEGLGMYALMLSISLIAFNVIETRTSESVVYFLAQKNSKNLVLTTSLFFDILSLILITCLMTIFFPFIKNNLQGMSSVPNTVFLLGILINTPLMLYKSLSGLFNYNENFVSYNLLAIFPIIMKVVLLYILNPENISEIIKIIFLLNFIYGIFSIALILKKISFKLKFDFLFFKSYFIFSYKSFLSTTLKSLHQNSDKIFVNIFMGNSSVGILDILNKVARLGNVIMSPISTILLPKMSKSFRETKKIDFENIFKTSLLFSIISIIVATLVFSLKEPFFYILGLKLDSISNSLIILFLSIAITKSIAWWVRALPVSIGKPEIPIGTNLIEVIIINLSFYLFIDKYGLFAVGIVKLIIPLITILYVYTRVKSHVNR